MAIKYLIWFDLIIIKCASTTYMKPFDIIYVVGAHFIDKIEEEEEEEEER